MDAKVTQLSRNQPHRGRPAQISREAILEAAGSMDLRELSMSSVAASLGVTHRALYRYFPTRSHLLAAVAGAVVGRLPVPPREGRTWEKWLTAVADVLRDVLVENLALLPHVPASLTIAQIPLFDATLTVLLEIGLTPMQALDASQLISGCCIIEASAVAVAREHAPLTEAQYTHIAREAGRGQGSTVSRLARDMASHDTKTAFHRRLDTLFDAFRCQAAANKPASKSSARPTARKNSRPR